MTTKQWAIIPLAVALVVLLGRCQVQAQEIHSPLADRLPGPIPGCRYTEWIPEAYVGPDTAFWLVLWNPLPVAQTIEVTLYDDGSHSPSWHTTVPAQSRTSQELFADKRPFLRRLRALSVEVRWQYAGSSALASWPLIYDRPLVLSEGKALTLCLDQ